MNNKALIKFALGNDTVTMYADDIVAIVEHRINGPKYQMEIINSKCDDIAKTVICLDDTESLQSSRTDKYRSLSYQVILTTIEKIKDDPFIGDIVIGDDNSTCLLYTMYPQNILRYCDEELVNVNEFGNTFTTIVDTLSGFNNEFLLECTKLF